MKWRKGNPLTRGCVMSRRTGPSKVQADMVAARAAGMCEAVFVGEDNEFSGCIGVAEHMHHRLARKMGGTRRKDANSPANLLHICHVCHIEIEAHPAYARSRGLMISQHCTEPVSHIPVWRRGERVLLDDHGGVVDQTVTF